MNHKIAARKIADLSAALTGFLTTSACPENRTNALVLIDVLLKDLTSVKLELIKKSAPATDNKKKNRQKVR